MQLSRLTRTSVLRAIDECRDLGRSYRCIDSAKAYKADQREWAWAADFRRRRSKANSDQSIEAITEAKLFSRFGAVCVYCGGPFECLDHVITVAAGGTTPSTTTGSAALGALLGHLRRRSTHR